MSNSLHHADTLVIGAGLYTLHHERHGLAIRPVPIVKGSPVE